MCAHEHIDDEWMLTIDKVCMESGIDMTFLSFSSYLPCIIQLPISIACDELFRYDLIISIFVHEG